MTTGQMLFQIALLALQGFGFGLICEMFLIAKKTGTAAKIIRVALWGLVMFLSTLPVLFMDRASGSTYCLALFIAFAIGLMILAYQISMPRMAACFSLSVLCLLVFEVGLDLFFHGQPILETDWTLTFFPGVLVLASLVLIALQYGSARLLKGWMTHEVVVYLVISFSALAALVLISGAVPASFHPLICPEMAWSRMMERAMDHYSIFTSLILGYILVYFVLSARKNRQETELYEQLQQMQSDYYHSLEKGQQSLARLRHDFKNVLLAANGLIQSGKPEEAKDLIHSFSASFQAPEALHLSSMPSIQIALSQKKRDLAAKGIDVDISLDIPETLQKNVTDLSAAILLMLEQAASELSEGGSIHLKSIEEDGSFNLYLDHSISSSSYGDSPHFRSMVETVAARLDGKYVQQALTLDEVCWQLSMPLAREAANG